MKSTENIEQPPSEQTQFVWGMRAIGKVLGGLNPDQVGYLIRNGKLTTKIVGRRHLTTVEQIHRDLLETGNEPPNTKKKRRPTPQERTRPSEYRRPAPWGT